MSDTTHSLIRIIIAFHQIISQKKYFYLEGISKKIYSCNLYCTIFPHKVVNFDDKFLD